MKRALLLVSFVYTLLCITPIVTAQSTDKIYFFYGDGCPHCTKIEQYFVEQDFYSKYPIEKKEIYFNRDNAVLFNSVMDEKQVPQRQRGVPTIVVGQVVLIGDKTILDGFVSNADALLQNRKQNSESSTSSTLQSTADTNNLTPLAVVVGALVDAINPCEFAVLILLMSTVLASGKAKKALIAGLAFSTSIFISYFLMGLGLYSAFNVAGIARVFYRGVGLLAIVLGVLNLKDYFWYGKGFLMEVPLSWRPKLKRMIQSVTSPIGAFSIGFVVSLFLLPCTSGPYIVILGMLAKKVSFIHAVFYLLLYNFIFVSPMIIISYAVYKGFDPNKAEEIRQKRLRLLHLIAGAIMLLMGLVIVLGWI